MLKQATLISSPEVHLSWKRWRKDLAAALAPLDPDPLNPAPAGARAVPRALIKPVGCDRTERDSPTTRDRDSDEANAAAVGERGHVRVTERRVACQVLYCWSI